MQTDITKAKRSLYASLKNSSEVLGAAIQEKNGSEFIVIFLSKISDEIRNKIPVEFEGNKVEIQIKSSIHAFQKL